jgi:hypothetical protein
MAIIKQQYPYEYLVRFNADGTVRGQHIKYLDKVFDEETGEVYAEKEGDALSVGDEQSAVMLDTALTEVAAGLARAEESRRKEADQGRQELAAEKAAHKAEIEARKAAEAAAEQLSQVLAEERTKKQALEQRLEEVAELGEVIIGLVESGEEIPEEVVSNAKAKIATGVKQ